MAKRSVALLLSAFAASVVLTTPSDAAGQLMYGCCTRPACGKVCKLVCETKKLTVFGYGCECKDICIPGPSLPGCKHCCTICCGECGGNCCCQEEPAKLEFCWRDWCACGCAKPRTVKVLTKYQAEKEICWYHWEVVDACGCGCGDGRSEGCGEGVDCGADCGCVYKEAPADAQIGAVVELTEEERVQLASRITDTQEVAALQQPATEMVAAADYDQIVATQEQAVPSEEAAADSPWQKMRNLFRLPGQE